MWKKYTLMFTTSFESSRSVLFCCEAYLDLNPICSMEPFKGKSNSVKHLEICQSFEGCLAIQAVKVSIQGDARLSYFLSAARKDLVNANEVSLLPLYILAIGPWRDALEDRGTRGGRGHMIWLTMRLISKIMRSDFGDVDLAASASSSMMMKYYFSMKFNWCKKYPSMELRGRFQYLVNQLKRGQGIELVLLQELVHQMANVQYTENLTEEQRNSSVSSYFFWSDME
ncbi:hypothetical protein DKX38_028052 [Salix brachista]|uniref:Uncharacterized protein n=1 Tax=Salix brachista TaxID=2182728 RepID=A0A5N5J6M1_9ROSI|nr:hypothetical protein DKX38_028045 [Salix brachista]KAB5514146.1 hypothetical protein DKX38_028052 [Salix brachista]